MPTLPVSLQQTTKIQPMEQYSLRLQATTTLRFQLVVQGVWSILILMMQTDLGIIYIFSFWGEISSGLAYKFTF